ncbi:unnamed protein product, partial [Discosporangium mesarthrocarpum]
QASYILQTCARIAGVLGEEFYPYLGQALPPLLAALSADSQMKACPPAL